MAIEPAESAGKLWQEALEIVRAHLIDGQEYDQRRRWRGFLLGYRDERARQREEYERESIHAS
jgi:hypothetical protein